MAPFFGPSSIEPAAELSNFGHGSIYDRLDPKTLLPLDATVSLLGCVGPSCNTTDDRFPGRSQQEVFRRPFDVHTSFIQPADEIFTAIVGGDELRLHHFSWQLGRECFDPPEMTWRSIANGDWDEKLLVPAARHIVTKVTRPIVLALCNEMMGKDFIQACGNYPRYDPECPAAYKAMYSHVRKVFAQEGVTHKHVVWSWQTYNVPVGGSAHNNKTRQLIDDDQLAMTEKDWDDWYVGDDQVSWVGINAFNGAAGSASIRQLYEPFYRWVAAKSVLPFFHAFGTAERSNDLAWRKAWFEELPSLLGPSGPFSRVRVATLYPEDVYDPQTSDESIAGFKWAANSPVFDAFGYANATARSCCGGPNGHAEPCCWEGVSGRGVVPQMAPPRACNWKKAARCGGECA